MSSYTQQKFRGGQKSDEGEGRGFPARLEWSLHKPTDFSCDDVVTTTYSCCQRSKRKFNPLMHNVAKMA